MPVKADFFDYFAYGSNMSIARLRAIGRAPSAVFVTSAFVAGYRLTFDKVSKDGSGKADCERTGDEMDFVYGGLFRLAQADRPDLDRAEGLGTGYEALTIQVQLATGDVASALTYVATEKSSVLRPFSWYVRHVLLGAQGCNLPVEYIATIGQVSTKDDLDSAREARELSIYSS